MPQTISKDSSEYLTGLVMHMSVVQNLQINTIKIIAYLHIMTKELWYHTFHGCFHNWKEQNLAQWVDESLVPILYTSTSCSVIWVTIIILFL